MTPDISWRSPAVAATAESQPATLVTGLLAGLAMAAMIGALSHGLDGPLNWLLLAWWCSATIWSGSIALRLLSAETFPGALPLAAVTGITITSLLLLSAIISLGIPAASVMSGWCGLVTLAAFLLAAPAGWRVTRPDELAVFLLCCAVSYAWCLPTSRAVDVLTATGRFPAWTDYFIHAGAIARFGPYAAFDRGFYAIVDAALPFYHYAGFALPATFAGLSGASPLEASVSTWPGLSFLMLTAGVAAIGSRLRGSGLAVASVAAIAALPDPSFYGFGNSFFGFHWLLLTAPGSGYGIGIIAAAAVLLIGWVSQPRKRLLAGSAMLGIFSILFRLHCAILFAPVWLAVIFLHSGGATPRSRRVKLAAAGAAIMLVVAYAMAGPLRQAVGLRMNLLAYIDAMLWQNSLIGVDPQYRALLAHSAILAAVFGLAVLLLSALGAPLLVYLGFVGNRLFGRKAGLSDLVPGLFVFSFAGAMVFAPAPWTGDFTEFKHRGFVLIYAMIVPWAVLAMLELCRHALPRSRSLAVAGSGVAVAAAIMVPLLYGPQMSAPRFAWGALHFDTSIDPALSALAAHLRAHAGGRDVLTLDRPDPEAVLEDQSTIITALTGIPAFVSRVKIMSERSDDLARTVRQRLAQLDAVAHAGSFGAAASLLQQAGVRWYMAAGSPQWDPGGSRPDFKAGGWLLYRFD